MDDLLARDRRHLWHPYTQHQTEPPALAVAEAHGALLTLQDGRVLIDAISSWWACLHGHGVPELADAAARQARTLDHVLFAGATHEPAVRLAEQLVEATPEPLTRVFYSDNGSTAVEIALKMAYQQWVHSGEPQRRVFVALEGSYHGDTFGAMSVGDPDPFFEPFRPLLFEAVRVPAEAGALEAALDELGTRAAGVLLEPLVQGAAGMRMHDESFLRAARAACDGRRLPLLLDEVMTGFGRTGALFACVKAGVAPDLLCLSKGLTGGTMPLAVTLATEAIFGSFLSEDRARAFFHGHTYTANPIGCAVALASLQLVRENDVPGRLDALGRSIEVALMDGLGAEASTALGLRRTGGIVALDLPVPKGTRGYLASIVPRLRATAIEHGVLLRPLGDVLYAMPPACTTDGEAERIVAAMLALVEECGAPEPA